MSNHIRAIRAVAKVPHLIHEMNRTFCSALVFRFDAHASTGNGLKWRSQIFCTILFIRQLTNTTPNIFFLIFFVSLAGLGVVISWGCP